MVSRYQKEAEFHNDEYTEGLRRRKTDRYYEVIESSSAFYREHLITHALGSKVLEYGCGRSSFAPLLARTGASRVIGIDISEVAVRRSAERAAREGCEVAEYHVMNAEKLEFPDSSFDLICGVAILHHLELGKALSEIARTLKPTGSAIFLEPLAHNPVINLYRHLTPRLRTEDEHPLTMNDLKTAKWHFERMDLHFFHLLDLLAVPFRSLPIFSSLLNALQAADRSLFSLKSVGRFAWSVAIILSQPRNFGVPNASGAMPGSCIGASEG